MNPHPTGRCNAGFLKTCFGTGIVACEACSNQLPLFAEYTLSSGNNEYSRVCPWSCFVGFFYNASLNLCLPCSGYKPNNSHFVLASSSQVHQLCTHLIWFVTLQDVVKSKNAIFLGQHTCNYCFVSTDFRWRQVPLPMQHRLWTSAS